MVCHRFCRFIHVHAGEDFSEPIRDYSAPSPEETGVQRVTTLWKRFFGGDIDYGDVNLIRNGYLVGGVVGLIYGAVFSSKDAVTDFIRKHNDYTFKGQYEARRRLTDYIAIHVLRKGWMTCWRMSLFTGTLVLLTVSSATYRNDIYIRDFAASGALVGGLWKVKYGLKATTSGAVVAGTLGLICGCMTKLVMLASGQSYAEFRAHMYDAYEYTRVKESRKITEKYHKDDFGDLLEHEKRLEKVKTEVLWSDGFFENKNK